MKRKMKNKCLAGGKRRAGITLPVLQKSLQKSQKSSDSKASPGTASAADPSLKNRARVLVTAFARRFVDFRMTFS